MVRDSHRTLEAAIEHPPGLPKEFIDRLSSPFERFLGIETLGGCALLLSTVAALAVANSPWSEPYARFWEIELGVRIAGGEFVRPLREWINDGLMTLFFFVVALELKRQLVRGELRHPGTATLSIASALGGMLIPAAIYLALQWGAPGAHGWGVVMATDTAFVVGCLALLGSRVPESLRIFLLSLAIVDDIGAVLVVALGYGSAINWSALAFGALGLGGVLVLARAGVRQVPVYVVIGGLTWLAVDASGIHATVTGVILGLLTPARRWVSDERLYVILGRVVAHPASEEGSGDTKDRETLQMAELAARESLSPVERLEWALHPWVGLVIMPLFALANAGFPLSLDRFGHALTVAVFLGFFLGKPIGVVGFAWLAVRLGIAQRPPSLSWGLLIGGGMLAGIGFTMALFIAGLAFDERFIDNAKLGIFSASAACAVAGLATLRLTARRPRRGPGIPEALPR